MIWFQSFAGIAGALLIGLGVIGAAIAGVFVDKTKKFEEVEKIGFCMTALSAIFFALVSYLRFALSMVDVLK